MAAIDKPGPKLPGAAIPLPFRYMVSMLSVAVITVLMVALRPMVNQTTVALGLLIVVLTTATFLGRNPALLASFAAMLCFNFFFFPPYYTWTIADPENLVAWAAFTITAITAGELSEYARRRAVESERLYVELQGMFASATEAEALRQSEKLKSALLDAVTHDLRTPLTSIKASVTTLIESEGGHRTIELDQEARTEFLDIINEETDRLNRFIEEMTSLARIEAGDASASGTGSYVDEAVALALHRAANLTNRHQIEVDIASSLPEISVDPRAMGEVIYNLVDNATKYSPYGSKICISAAANGDRVRIRVADAGPGIPVHMRERVFEKFERINGTQPAGLGLGLSIARAIIESNHGRIWIEEGEPVGTVIVIEVPVRYDN